MHKFIVSWLKQMTWIGALAALPVATSAAPVVCPGSAECNGNSYSATYTQTDSNTWQVQVDVDVLGSIYAAPGSYLLSALAIKNVSGSDIANASLVSAPTDDFAFYAGELNNGGAICGNDKNAGTKICAWAGDGKGAELALGHTLSFVFQFDSPAVADSIHLKYQYLAWDAKKQEWKKWGSLGSFDIPLLAQCTNGDCEPDPCTRGGCGDVPLPASAALFGAGIIAFRMTRGRRRASRSARSTPRPT